MKNLFLITAIIFLGNHITFGQCFPDQHNTNWYDGWISCEASQNPNIDRGISHWLMYDLGTVYKLGATHIWNTNDPDYLERGMRNVLVDYSIDGNTWIEFGVFTFEQADGLPHYEGFEGFDFEGIEAQYVMLTAIDNYGDYCYGLSELKINVERLTTSTNEPAANPENCLTVHLYPNPFAVQAQLKITSRCGEQAFYSILNVLGEVIMSETSIGSEPVNFELNGENWTPGLYILSVRVGNKTNQYKFTKI